MSELPGDIQVARVKAIAQELFVDSSVVGDDGPRISNEGVVDCEPVIAVHLRWREDGQQCRATLLAPVDTFAAMATDALTEHLRTSAKRAEERHGVKFLRAP